MKNPFKRSKKNQNENNPSPLPTPAEEAVTEPVENTPDTEKAPENGQETAPADSFIEWRRSQVRGGIERRERNDIYEAYSVFGTDGDGRLMLRYYHRYPEHERDFDLSYSRELSFGDFNRRLLSELDYGGLTLADYHACIAHAEQITGAPETSRAVCGFSEAEEAALRGFCDDADILKEQSYLHSEGVLSCACAGAVGDDRLILRFRRPLPHDALDASVPGVSKEEKSGYDIENLWIMGVYNRLRERCSAVAVTRLTSEWSIEKESLWLFSLEGFEGVGGSLLAAIGEADSFRRFGFWSLDFSKK